MGLEKNNGIAVAIFTKDVLEIVYNKLINLKDSDDHDKIFNTLLEGLFPDIEDKINNENGIAFVYSKYALYVTHINKRFDYHEFSRKHRLITIEDDYTKLSLLCKENKKCYNMNFNLVSKNKLTSTKWDRNKEPMFIKKAVAHIAKHHLSRMAINGKGKISEIIILIKENENDYKQMAETFSGEFEGISVRYLVAKT